MRARILVVDDDALFRAWADDALAGLGYDLRVAADVQEALAVLREVPVDVVVADHVMPGTSGLTLLTSMRDHLPGPKRILVSSSTDPALLVEAINQAEVFRFLPKPCEPNALRLAVWCAVRDAEREEESMGLAALARESAGIVPLAAG